ncbi:hypothetical protein PROFUN_12350 [Planoprotostelium fungivorum]|uniref:Methyltransferase type 11 domain-containing protein n=1 Tax=Planoprotostelium fungivorum TaxID=1890364 RepID=A0A2P6N9E7_9EUKA|nr:hypothetical protein PROFUN_12350 [Planoprotostelium fungivorum]
MVRFESQPERNDMTQVHYGRPEYWEERYSKDLEPFDWYQRFAGLKQIITKHTKTNNKIVYLGCGTSRLPEEMVAYGYKDVLSIDWSLTLISHLQEKHKSLAPLTYLRMNALGLELSDNHYDCVIDKGTLDSILVSQNIVSFSTNQCGEESTININRVLSEVYRILKPGGVFVCVSHANPEHRIPLFEKSIFEKSRVEVTPVEKPQVLSTSAEPGTEVHYVYTVSKEKEVV